MYLLHGVSTVYYHVKHVWLVPVAMRFLILVCIWFWATNSVPDLSLVHARVREVRCRIVLKRFEKAFRFMFCLVFNVANQYHCFFCGLPQHEITMAAKFIPVPLYPLFCLFSFSEKLPPHILDESFPPTLFAAQPTFIGWPHFTLFKNQKKERPKCLVRAEPLWRESVC